MKEIEKELKDIVENNFSVSTFVFSGLSSWQEIADEENFEKSKIFWNYIFKDKTLSTDFLLGYGQFMELTVPLWGSADGARTKLCDLKHSHISNIYYFSILFERPFMMNMARYVIFKYHNGKMLDYNPMLKAEFDQLEYKGCLKNERDGVYDIFMLGSKVGELDIEAIIY